MRDSWHMTESPEVRAELAELGVLSQPDAQHVEMRRAALQTLLSKAMTSENALDALWVAHVFDTRRVSAPSSIRPYRTDPRTRHQSCTGPN